MKPALKASLTALVFALGVPLAATARVSYTYTAGSNYTDASAVITTSTPYDSTTWRDVGAEQALLHERLTFSLDTPDYLPAGWSTLTGGGYPNAMLSTLSTQDHPTDPNAFWFAESGLFSGSGVVNSGYDLVTLSMSVHVGADHAIDAWEFAVSYVPSDDWQNYVQSGLIGSSVNGDLTYSSVSAKYYLKDYSAATSVIGTWEFSGSPDTHAPVPEPATYAMLLAGLGMIGVTARRKQWLTKLGRRG